MKNFQRFIWGWVCSTFGFEYATHKRETGNRFIEEAIELVQACDIPKEDVLQMVERVYSREPGNPSQEVGGVMVTLARLCSVFDWMELENCAWNEYTRIDTLEVRQQIRQKQPTKERNYPCPKIEGMQ